MYAPPPLPNRTAQNYGGGTMHGASMGAPPLPFASAHLRPSPGVPPHNPLAPAPYRPQPPYIGPVAGGPSYSPTYAHPPTDTTTTAYPPSYAPHMMTPPSPAFAAHPPQPSLPPRPHSSTSLTQLASCGYYPHSPPAETYVVQQQPHPTTPQLPPRPAPAVIQRSGHESFYSDCAPPPSQSGGSANWLSPAVPSPTSVESESSTTPSPQPPFLPSRPHAIQEPDAHSTSAASMPPEMPLPTVPKQHVPSQAKEEPIELVSNSSTASSSAGGIVPTVCLSNKGRDDALMKESQSHPDATSPSLHRRTHSLPSNSSSPVGLLSSQKLRESPPRSGLVPPPKPAKLSSSSSSRTSTPAPTSKNSNLSSTAEVSHSGHLEREQEVIPSAPAKETLLDEVPPEYSVKPLPCPPKKKHEPAVATQTSPVAPSVVKLQVPPIHPTPQLGQTTPVNQGNPSVTMPAQPQSSSSSVTGNSAASSGRPGATYHQTPNSLIKAFIPPKPAEQPAKRSAEAPAQSARPTPNPTNHSTPSPKSAPEATSTTLHKPAFSPPAREPPIPPAISTSSSLEGPSEGRHHLPSESQHMTSKKVETGPIPAKKTPPAPPASNRPITERAASQGLVPTRKMPSKPLPPPGATACSTLTQPQRTAPAVARQFQKNGATASEPAKDTDLRGERQNSCEGINTTISFTLNSMVIFISEVDRFFLCTIEVKWGSEQWVIKRNYGQFQAFDAWTNHYVKTINQLPYPLPPAKKFVKPKEKNLDKRCAEMKKYIAGVSSFVHLFLSHKVGRAMILRFFAPIQPDDVLAPGSTVPFDVPPALPQGKLIGW